MGVATGGRTWACLGAASASSKSAAEGLRRMSTRDRLRLRRRAAPQSRAFGARAALRAWSRSVWDWAWPTLASMSCASTSLRWSRLRCSVVFRAASSRRSARAVSQAPSQAGDDRWCSSSSARRRWAKNRFSASTARRSCVAAAVTATVSRRSAAMARRLQRSSDASSALRRASKAACHLASPISESEASEVFDARRDGLSALSSVLSGEPCASAKDQRFCTRVMLRKRDRGRGLLVGLPPTSTMAPLAGLPPTTIRAAPCLACTATPAKLRRAAGDVRAIEPLSELPSLRANTTPLALLRCRRTSGSTRSSR